jgi:hypothetical protein
VVAGPTDICRVIGTDRRVAQNCFAAQGATDLRIARLSGSLAAEPALRCARLSVLHDCHATTRKIDARAGHQFDTIPRMANDDTDKHMMQSPDCFSTAVAWGTLFQEHGCLVCHSKTNVHAGWGFCLECASDRLVRFQKLKKDIG